jgi:DNA-binding transcriptional regulator YhcF (GntR family)
LLDEAGLISTQQGRGTYIWEAPSDETLNKLRQEGLDGLTRRYLAQASRLAFTPEEVEQAVVQHLQTWKDDGPFFEPETIQ